MGGGKGPMNPDLDGLLGDFSPAVQGIALSAREQIRELVPDAQEKVIRGYRAVSFHLGGAMKDQFVSLVLHRAHVNLQFARGAELPDPGDLLEGTGKLMRHIKLREVRTVQDAEVGRMIEAAAGQARKPAGSQGP
ncbi:MAG: DUF1801 domain-containing protein [Gemmatimonadales bacterium]|nr:MAG: DUF1801 domain-containing protein [Gemmatimonadales bacterium]